METTILIGLLILLPILFLIGYWFGKRTNKETAIQKKTREENHYQLRIGIHLGEVSTTHNDVFGDGVNIASRIQSIAEPGAVFISEAVYSNIKNKVEEPVEFVGEKELKNIDEPVKIYKVNVS